MRFFRVLKKLIYLIAMLAAAGIAHAEIVVIGNPTITTQQLSASQLGALYLKQNSSINDQTISPLDQPQGSALYQQFYQTSLNWSPSQVNSYWSQKIFSGTGSQPPSAQDSMEAIKQVEQTPGLIAYVDSSVLARSGAHYRVKVLYGKSPWNKYTNTLIKHDHSKGGLVTASHYGLQQSSASHVDKNPHALLTHAFKPYALGDSSGKSLWAEITAGFQLEQSAVGHAAVLAQVQRYLAHRSTLNMMLNNSIPYIGYVYQQVHRRHMPTEFALLPFIESAYNPFAYSRVGASGLWQMMPQTASIYGLNISWWYDARRDLLISTKAALDFLQRLHHQFGDWLLAAAAYDDGGGAISGAIKDAVKIHGHSNYWLLSLPHETQQYVPKLLAFAYIIKHADQYHIALPKIPVHTFFTQVQLTSQLDLHEISQLADVSENLILYLNPGMRRFATKPGKFMLLLPTNRVPEFEQNLMVKQHRVHTSWLYHEVWSGETLAKIAHDYHTQVGKLRTVNSMPTGDVRPGEGLLVPVILNRRYTPAIVRLQKNPQPRMALQNITAKDILSGHIKRADKKPNVLPPTKPFPSKSLTNKKSSLATNKKDSNTAKKSTSFFGSILHFSSLLFI